ncbi:hypothetical protein J5491_00320 [Candidatus Saccharibacteria bacterium]|nr:hypothetical protein [Candidatus Saccharibacteria bacterium]
MIKKGDTLIEVTLAIGIFSMVAVSVVAVMSNGTAGAETALETTLTRQEIDAQAEALRFIHSSYISDQNLEDDRYYKLWKTITDPENVIDLTTMNEEAKNEILNYSPTTCDSLYTAGEDNTFPPLATQKAFVVDTNYLGNYSSLDAGVFKEESSAKEQIDKIVISYIRDGREDDRFSAAETYPHLAYKKDGSSEDASEENSALISSDYNVFDRAEGIYVIAVRDSGTNIAGEDSFVTESAFYDFYIRTCWYGMGDEFPSTISTVIRLYNPDVIVARKPKQKEEPEPEPEPAKDYMQDATSESLAALMPNNGDSTKLKDKRDEKEYGIAKINDKYWMTTNLNLAGGTKLTPESTDMTSGSYELPQSAPNADFKGVYNSGQTECSESQPCYSYYSYNVATLGRPALPYTICPKGWTLPRRSDFEGLISTYPTGAALTSSPFNAVYAGEYMDKEYAYRKVGLNGGGVSGDYWAYDYYGEYGYFGEAGGKLSISESDVFVGADAIVIGSAVRCLKK